MGGFFNGLIGSSLPRDAVMVSTQQTNNLEVPHPYPHDNLARQASSTRQHGAIQRGAKQLGIHQA
jgi:hypothetical protein